MNAERTRRFYASEDDLLADIIAGYKRVICALYLEFDDARSGGFDCLRQVSADKKVVLGLVTMKTP